MKNSSNLYNKDYFENGIEKEISLYANYRWLPELTIPFCFSLIEKLNIKETDTILDFGCAKGYTVKGLRLLYRQAWGCDISEYAISQSPTEIKKYLIHLQDSEDLLDLNNKFNWVISKDVFEHIPYNNIGNTLKKINRICDNLFCAVPLAENHKYIIPDYEKDITHVIRENIEWWSDLFVSHNFEIKESSYNMPHMKDNWKNWEKGNGFFVLKKNSC